MATISTVPAPPLAVPSARKRDAWNTLERLKGGRLLLLALDAVLLGMLLAASRLEHDAIRTVGQDAAPSIIAAQHIKTAVAGMDAEVAHELLVSAENGSSSLANFDAERTEAANSLVTAAENITYGEAERGPVRTLQNGLAVYEDLVQRARDVHELEASDSAATLDAYHQAQTMTDRSLLPAADDLDAANLTELERTYGRAVTGSVVMRGATMLVGLALFAALLWLQVYLSRQTKRTLNPALLLATVLTCGFTLYAVGALTEAQYQLRVAKQDAFTSIHALWRARAVGYQAASDESRFLLDPARSAQSQSDFAEHAAALAQLPEGQSVQEVLAAEADGKDVGGLSGFLPDELNNITFPGEGEAAVRTLADWEQYLALDTQVRQLKRTGRLREAADLSTATASSGAGGAFKQFDRDLQTTLDINQRVFDRSVAKAGASLGGFNLKASVAATLIGLLAVAGLAPRIREYR